MTALSTLLRDAAARLAAAGVDSPALDARILAEHVFGLSPTDIRRNPAFTPAPADRARFGALVARRAGREPLQRLVGRWEFWGLDLALGPDTLIPRADTETLVDAVLKRRPDRSAPLRLLDLGTGTGAILLALLHERPAAVGVGVDLAPGAVVVARANAESVRVAARAVFLVSDWDTALAPGERFDVVASNPPYIPDAEIEGLEPEVALHEPRRALAGGVDGLDPYRRIAAMLPDRLKPGGLAALEHGADQGPAVRALLAAVGLRGVETVDDLGGRERVTIGVLDG